MKSSFASPRLHQALLINRSICSTRNYSTTPFSKLDVAITQQSSSLESLLKECTSKHILGIPSATMKSILGTISSRATSNSELDEYIQLAESGKIVVSKHFSEICIASPQSIALDSEVYETYLDFLFNTNAGRPEFDNDVKPTPSRLYNIITSKVKQRVWRPPSLDLHLKILDLAIQANDHLEIGNCYKAMEELGFLNKNPTHTIVACMKRHRQLYDLEPSWCAAEHLVKYAKTFAAFEAIIPVFLYPKNFLLFDSEDYIRKELAHDVLSPKNLLKEMPPHQSTTINRITKLLKTMVSLGLDPTRSKYICSAMTRFCGNLGLEKCTEEWIGHHDLKGKVFQTNIISALILRWRRMCREVHRFGNNGKKQVEIIELEQLIDERVTVCLTGGVDRVVVGMLVNHYVDRGRVQLAELILATFVEFDPQVMSFLDISIEYLPESDSPKIPKRFRIEGMTRSGSMYSALFVSYFMRGEHDRAEQLLSYLSSQNLEIDHFFLTKVISNCFMPYGDWDSVVAVIEQYSTSFRDKRLHPTLAVCMLATLNRNRRLRMQESEEWGKEPLHVLSKLEPILAKYHIDPKNCNVEIMVHLLRLFNYNLDFLHKVYSAWILDKNVENITCAPNLQAYVTLLAMYLGNSQCFDRISRARAITRKMKDCGLWREQTIAWLAEKNGLSLADLESDS